MTSIPSGAARHAEGKSAGASHRRSLVEAMRIGLLTGAIAFVYFFAAKFGLSLAFANASASPVWPPTGLAIAAALILGRHALGGIFVGAFFANASTAGSIETSLLIAVGNTLEAAVAAFLAGRYAGGMAAFDSPRGIFAFTLLAAGFATTLSASIGVATLAAYGLASAEVVPTVWLTWWLGDAVGALLITPLIVLWWRHPGLELTSRRMVEAILLLLASAAIGAVVFWDVVPPLAGNLPIEFLGIPPIIWAAHRFGQRHAATVTLLLSTIAVYGTIHGRGPFVRASANDSLLLLQAFTAVLVLIALPLAAVVQTQRRAEAAAAEARSELEARVVERTRELAGSQSLLLGFTQNIPGLAWAKDAEGRYVLANKAFAATVGRTPEEIIGLRDADLFPTEIAEEFAQNDRQVRTTRAPLTTTERQPVKGEMRESLVNKFLVPIDAGHPLIGGVAVDITDRKRAEAAVLRSLREKEALLKEIHHRVKNNLQVTSGLLLLQANRTKDEAARALLLDSTNRLRSMALVHEKLYESTDLAAIDLAEYAHDLTQEFLRAHDVATRGITTRVEVPRIRIDADTAVSCGLILNELLANAIKHAFPHGRGGRIVVSAHPEGDKLLSLTVADDGVGMSSSIDFETATTMGMRLVAGLAKQLGGTVTVARDHGTAVRVTFKHSEKSDDDHSPIA